jgi:hypothetical protein
MRYVAVICVAMCTSAYAGVWISAPKNNSTVSTSVQFVATAQGCSKGVAAMGIYPTPGNLVYTVKGASLNHSITLNPGTYNVVVQEWDNCGWSSKASVNITVGSGGTSSKTFLNLHQKSGWKGYALLPPNFPICQTCTPSGPGVTWSMTQGISSPSLSGSSAKMSIGGTTQYGDVLWNNHLIGDFSSQGLPDWSKTLVPSLHNFVYDVYFFGKDLSVSQALEFDINQFVGGKSYIWGHECRIAGGHQWDIWDNPGQKWIPTGIPCNPVSNAWNHLVITVARTSNNQLLFKSISLNGKTSVLNHYENPTPTNWYGVTINYQQDGNSKMQPYTIYLDKLHFTYW